jgi:hypothetical protein
MYSKRFGWRPEHNVRVRAPVAAPGWGVGKTR